MKFRRPARKTAAALAGGALLAALLAAAGVWAGVRWGRFPEEEYAAIARGRLYLGRGGGTLRVKLDGGGMDSRPGYRPRPEDWITKALIAAEDQRFWKHGGVDWVAVARAGGQNAGALRRISGASTLSTQVIRLMHPRPRVMRSKIVEAYRAMQMERRHSKEEILGQYLDRAPFGGNIMGIEAAARRYFGKGAGELSLGEASLLAGIPQSPSRLRPDRHCDRAKKRQAYVLRRMAEEGMITEEQRARALEETLAVRDTGYPKKARHFCDWLEDTEEGGAAEAEADAEGGAVRTTLDEELEAWCEAAVRQAADEAGTSGGAVVVLEVAGGAVRAMAGSPDYDSPEGGQVNGALSPRSAGSTLKPFCYAMAFDAGFIHAGTHLRDARRSWKDYDPRNYEGRFAGWISAREALVDSLNLPALDVEERVGPAAFHHRLTELGLSTLEGDPWRYGMGLALGNGEVRLLELANAYACLARGGVWKPVHGTERGAEEEARSEGVRLFGEEAAWMVADILSGDERAMDATGHRADVRLPRWAWKTGTSSGLRDAWTVAWNPRWVVGVWLGNVDGKSGERLVGRLSAAPLAWRVARRLEDEGAVEWYRRPEGVFPLELCAESGLEAGADCTRRTKDWGIRRVTRRAVCPGRHGGDGDGTDAAEGAPDLRVTVPTAGGTYRLAGGDGIMMLRATGGREGAVRHWFVDGAPVGSEEDGDGVAWPMAKGPHTAVCAEENGGPVAEASFTVTR